MTLRGVLLGCALALAALPARATEPVPAAATAPVVGLPVEIGPAAGAAATAPSAATEPAPSGPPAPFQSIRRLQMAQEQIAQGSRAAQATQARLMAAMPSDFLAADPVVWRDPRNARAAVLYLFSGGRPSVVRTVITRSSMPRDLDRLLKGALAYAEGQDAIALELLEPIDPRSVPSTLGGHLALVQATLLAGKDKAKAGRLLSVARLLVPGTLVEEAALRRQIFLDNDPASLPSFVFLSHDYLHRFRNSIYAENFKRHFVAIALQVAGGGDVSRIRALEPAIAELPPEEQSALYLSMAKAAVVRGRTEAARFAADCAAEAGRASTRDVARAQLYRDAAMIVSEDVAKGVAALEAADRSRLSPGDADLRDAALAVARAVTRPVPDSAASPAPAPAADGKAGNSVIEDARRALAGTDGLLDDGAP